MSVFRSQEIRERCKACEAPAEGQCRKCQLWICAEHTNARLECCSACAAEIDLQISRAGYAQRGLGAALTFFATGFTYLVATFHLMTPAIAALLIAGGASGLGLLGWSFAVSRHRTRRRLEKQLEERKLLAAPRTAPGETDD